jgi:AraC family transcriptional regulator of adaptative response/methylated-DNA-[protein]-cysteine methyltransferase
MTTRSTKTRAPSSSLTTLLDVCRQVDADPTARHDLKALGRRAGLSTFQLHRLFKSFLGITPREYVEQARVQELKRRLRTDSSVTNAIYDAGFESSSSRPSIRTRAWRPRPRAPDPSSRRG